MKRSVALLVSFVFLAGCGPVSCIPGAGAHEIWSDDRIDPEVKAAVEPLVSRVLDAARSADLRGLMKLYHPSVLEQENLREQLEQMMPILQDAFSDREAVVFQDHYIRFASVGQSLAAIPVFEPMPYVLSVQPSRYPTYLALIRLIGADQDAMIFVLAIEDGGAWFLHTAYLGDFALAGKTAVEWYEQARAGEEDADPIETWWRLFAAAKTLRPATFMQYVQESEIQSMIARVKTGLETEHEFPIEVRGLPNNIRVHGFDLLADKDGLVPAVLYASDVAIDDPDTLEAQAGSLLAWLEVEFSSFCSPDTSRVMFVAFEELPVDPAKIYPRYGLPVACGNQPESLASPQG